MKMRLGGGLDGNVLVVKTGGPECDQQHPH